jgi:uncharacterized protein (TIGR02646 family)
MIRLDRPACPYPKALADKNYKHPRNKSALADSTKGKCMYCESKIAHVNFGHVEHIKPKKVGLFPHLEFEWSNLGYVCDRCNNAKSSKWVSVEFIDPYSENPAVHLRAYGSLLLSRDASERGEVTVNEIELNRAELVEQRNTRIKAIHQALTAALRVNNLGVRESAIAELKKDALPDKEFSMVVGAYLESFGV